MGKHIADISPEQIVQAVRFNYIGNPFGIMAYSFPNISVALLINKLLAPNRTRAYALYALSISQCCIAGVSCILLFAQATPTEYLWNPTIGGKLNYSSSALTSYSYFVGCKLHGLSIRDTSETMPAYTAMTDIILAIVPIAAFWKLTLKTKTKVGLSFLMACTLFAAICAIVKTTKLNELADLADFTYGTVDLVIWAMYFLIDKDPQYELNTDKVTQRGSKRHHHRRVHAHIATIFPPCISSRASLRGQELLPQRLHCSGSQLRLFQV